MSLVFHGIINHYFIQHWDIIGLLQHSNANNIPKNVEIPITYQYQRVKHSKHGMSLVISWYN